VSNNQILQAHERTSAAFDVHGIAPVPNEHRTSGQLDQFWMWAGANVVGHYENQWFVTEGIELAMRDIGEHGAMEVMRVEHWAFCRQDTLDAVFPDGFPGIALEHAAVIETSMMLHYHPQLVSLERIPSHRPAQFPIYDMYPARTAWVPSSGVLSSAKDSSREKGRRLVTDVVDGIAAAVRHEFGLGETPTTPEREPARSGQIGLVETEGLVR